MKILVAMAVVPDTTSKIEFIDGNKVFKKEGVTFILNPYDEYALSKAVSLKTQNNVEITVVVAGSSETEPLIRKALAMGADQAVRLEGDFTESYSIAEAIATQASNYDLILLGKESIATNDAQVGGMLAALLDRPFIPEATALNLEGQTLTCTTESPSGQFTIVVNLPAVVSAAEGLAPQIMPNMRGIMSAKTKPLQVISISNLEVRSEVLAYRLPEARSGCRFFTEDQLEELLEVLKNKEKVI